MKFEVKRSVAIKIAFFGAIILLAPSLVPFLAEFIIMADIMGLEALILFLLYQGRHALAEAQYRLSLATRDIAITLAALAQCYIFQPKVFISHSIGSATLAVKLTRYGSED